MQLRASSHVARASALKGAHLTFLSLVDRAAVPLHLIAGSALEVWTESDKTQRWFEENVLPGFLTNESADEADGPLNFGYHESDTAVLLGVEGENSIQLSSDGPCITELLLYASITPPSPSIPSGILTPPRSSSPTPDAQQQPQHPPSAERSPLEVKIYALPLSSHLCYNPSFHQRPPTPPHSADLSGTIGCFLPPPDFSNPRKRQRLNSLFDGATKQTKRLKRNGGQTVAKIMASSAPQSSTTTAGSSKEVSSDKQPQMQVRKVPKPPVRSQSTTSLPDPEEARCRPHSRSCSGSRAIVRTKRSALHRVASANDAPMPGISETHSPSLDFPVMRHGTETQSFQEKNRSALSRVIMAGMRMHGFSQRKKSMPPPTPLLDSASSSRPATASGPTTAMMVAACENPEDEYKLVYHQTYKAATFTLRREMSSPIRQDRMREIVDVLLELFCGNAAEDEGLATNINGLGLEVLAHNVLSEASRLREDIEDHNAAETGLRNLEVEHGRRSSDKAREIYIS